MKKNFTILLAFFTTFSLFANVGTFSEGVTINGNTYGVNAALGAVAPNKLILNGGYSDTYQNGADDVCGVGFEYIVTTGGVNSGVILSYTGVGPSPGDKKWGNTTTNVNISNLTNGSYTLVVNFRIYGKSGGVPCGGSGSDFVTGVFKTLSYTFTVNSALPFGLQDFNVAKNEQNHILAWATETESNAAHFEIEKSINSTTWKNLGTVKAAGNSQRRLNYDFTDATPTQGVNYYRLKMVDRDGSFKYSKVISINFGKNNSVSIAPNPTSDHINVIFSEETSTTVATVEIFSLSGQSVQRQTLENNSIDVSNLNNGLYFIQITDDNGQVLAREKLIKN